MPIKSLRNEIQLSYSEEENKNEIIAKIVKEIEAKYPDSFVNWEQETPELNLRLFVLSLTMRIINRKRFSFILSLS